MGSRNNQNQALLNRSLRVNSIRSSNSYRPWIGKSIRFVFHSTNRDNRWPSEQRLRKPWRPPTREGLNWKVKEIRRNEADLQEIRINCYELWLDHQCDLILWFTIWSWHFKCFNQSKWWVSKLDLNWRGLLNVWK
jgi:hypothetical protein